MVEFDVVVCGLGPVGQLLSLLLGDFGVRTLAVDRAPGIHELPRAAVIDDEVLRILQSVGVDAAVLAGSQVQEKASILSAAGRPVEVFSARTGPLGHPPLVSIHQPTMERALIDALAQRRTVEVRRGLALDTVEQRAGGVDLVLRPEDGRPPTTVRARYLVGCDGATSTVRSRLDITLDGSTASQRWVVVDATVDRPLRKLPHPYFVGDARRPAVTLPMSPGRHRWEWMIRPGEDAAPFLEPAAIQAGMAPWLDGEHAEVERAVVYTFHTRAAQRWREGSIFLAGDAAHLMPPFAGQGFSSGARDAANLAWKLQAVLAGAPDGLLDSYERERRPHVAAMQRTAGLMGSLVQATSPATIRVRDAFLHGIDGTRVQRWITTHVKPLPSYGAGAFASRPARLPWRRTVGTLFPQTGRLDDALGTGWAAVSADAASTAALRAAGLRVCDPGADGAWLRERGCRWALLRPDRFVFACGGPGEIPAALAAWQPLAAAHARPQLVPAHRTGG